MRLVEVESIEETEKAFELYLDESEAWEIIESLQNQIKEGLFRYHTNVGIYILPKDTK